MIARRLIERLRHHEWLTVGIELVIVIVGVFIGVQASNWNEDRVEDQQAAVFTARLKADLRQEDWYYQMMFDYHRQVLANANRAAQALEGKTSLSDEALLVAAYRATQYKQGARRRSTYDELISTGRIGLIRDQALRNTAMSLYNLAMFDNLVQEGLHSRYREAFRMTLPNEVQRALAHQCGDRVYDVGDYAHLDQVLDFPCRTGLPPETLAASVRALRANPDLLPALRLRIADLETRLADMTGNYGKLWQDLRTVARGRP